ncbi:MAG: UbiX family flavin prenyltransferase [Planctomycetia bacterium]|nr:UbiX family flavin prenyltransferase [Planctomycetia bacterium]
MAVAKRTYVVAVTGASGALYARRLCGVLAKAKGVRVHLLMSEAGARVAREELGVSVDLADGASVMRGLIGEVPRNFRYERLEDIGASFASGTYVVDAMVVIPCSMGTLGRIASGTGATLIERGADVQLKERRNLILVVRETPLSLIAIENMARVARAGACVLPAMPGYYHLPKTVEEVVDFVVGKVLVQMGEKQGQIRRRVARGEPDGQ